VLQKYHHGRASLAMRTAERLTILPHTSIRHFRHLLLGSNNSGSCNGIYFPWRRRLIRQSGRTALTSFFYKRREQSSKTHLLTITCANAEIYHLVAAE
jgi:hypothetical protein